MKKDVIITIRGTQTTPQGEPETIELTTDAELMREGETVILRYQESPLTGLAGTTTTFRIRPDRTILERTGAVESSMEFVEGQSSDSLYRIEGGALLLRVYARRMRMHFEDDSGWFDLSYGIEIENTPSGTIDYHITVHPTI